MSEEAKFRREVQEELWGQILQNMIRDDPDRAKRLYEQADEARKEEDLNKDEVNTWEIIKVCYERVKNEELNKLLGGVTIEK